MAHTQVVPLPHIGLSTDEQNHPGYVAWLQHSHYKLLNLSISFKQYAPKMSYTKKNPPQNTKIAKWQGFLAQSPYALSVDLDK